MATLPSCRSALSALVITRPNNLPAKSQYKSTPLRSLSSTSSCPASAITVRSSMLDESPTSTVCPGGAISALRRPADGPRAGMFCQLIELPPEYRPVVLAPQKFRYTGSGPRRAVSTKRIARVSAMVVLTPSRAATRFCTSLSSWSSRSVKSLSLLANA